MANVTAVAELRNLAAYLQDGDAIEAALNAVVATLTPAQRQADALTLYRHAALDETGEEIDDDAGAVPLLAVVKSTGTAGFVSIWNVDFSSVTVGTTSQHLVVPVSGTSGEVTVMPFLGKALRTIFDTGLSIAAATTARGNTTMTNKPAVYVLYTNA